jgi:hypothetical protein
MALPWMMSAIPPPSSLRSGKWPKYLRSGSSSMRGKTFCLILGLFSNFMAVRTSWGGITGFLVYEKLHAEPAYSLDPQLHADFGQSRRHLGDRQRSQRQLAGFDGSHFLLRRRAVRAAQLPFIGEISADMVGGEPANGLCHWIFDRGTEGSNPFSSTVESCCRSAGCRPAAKLPSKANTFRPGKCRRRTGRFGLENIGKPMSRLLGPSLTATNENAARSNTDTTTFAVVMLYIHASSCASMP